MNHEDHAGHGAQGGDHRPGTGQLSPNEHRQHAVAALRNTICPE